MVVQAVVMLAVRSGGCADKQLCVGSRSGSMAHGFGLRSRGSGRRTRVLAGGSKAERVKPGSNV